MEAGCQFGHTFVWYITKNMATLHKHIVQGMLWVPHTWCKLGQPYRCLCCIWLIISTDHCLRNTSNPISVQRYINNESGLPSVLRHSDLCCVGLSSSFLLNDDLNIMSYNRWPRQTHAQDSWAWGHVIETPVHLTQHWWRLKFISFWQSTITKYEVVILAVNRAY